MGSGPETRETAELSVFVGVSLVANVFIGGACSRNPSMEVCSNVVLCESGLDQVREGNVRSVGKQSSPEELLAAIASSLEARLLLGHLRWRSLQLASSLEALAANAFLEALPADWTVLDLTNLFSRETRGMTGKHSLRWRRLLCSLGAN